MNIDFLSLIPTMLGLGVQVAIVAYFMGSIKSQVEATNSRYNTLGHELAKMQEEMKAAVAVRTETLKDVERMKVQLEHVIEKIDNITSIVKEIVKEEIRGKDH